MQHLILAGGGGTRLWPFSRTHLPKQFLCFQDNHSLLQKTILRFYPKYRAKNIWILTQTQYLALAETQSSALDPLFPQQILTEPCKKNTAPALCLAMKYLMEIQRIDPKELVLISPADQILSSPAPLFLAAKKGSSFVKKGYHLIFGIRPHKPETGYGYIAKGKKRGPGIFEVERFVEKPNRSTAQSYLLQGNYLWNAGIFLFQIESFLEEIYRSYPPLRPFLDLPYSTLYKQFKEMPEISIDYALLEKSNKLLVAPLDVDWSDVGSWDSIYELFDKDQNENVKMGNIVDIETKKCLILGQKRLISTIGLEELLIIDTDDVLFIGKKGQSQEIKQLISSLFPIDESENRS